MKSMASDNWLAFSLSPHINNNEEPSSSSVSNTVQNCNFFLSPTNTNAPSSCYEEENASLYSQLSFMPINSDGSLYIMEALNRSQKQGMEPSPKLEDFLGSCVPSTGGLHHHYMDNDKESSTMYYQPLHEIYHQPSLENVAMADEDGFPSLKNWFTINYNEMSYGDLQSLSLSMSPGSQSNSVSAPMALDATKKRGCGKGGQKQPVHRKSIDTFGQRTSQYRGVTRHRWTGRYEAHLWDNSCKKEGQTRKGRQVYLGGYDMEEKAARAYDLAALKYWGSSTHINFPLENYHVELEEMKNMSRQEYVAHLRRKSSGFSRGASMYRGVTRHHQHGRWQARIGRVAGNKDLYLGTFSTQEDAAEAYDIAAIKFRGASAVTNFDITRYDVDKIMASNTLLSGEDARRTKATDAQTCNAVINLTDDNHMVLYESPDQIPFTSSGTLGLIGIDETMKMASAHISNSSSLVTSLNSSREVSPEPRFNLSQCPISSWIQSTQIRPEISPTQIPVFAAMERL